MRLGLWYKGRERYCSGHCHWEGLRVHLCVWVKALLCTRTLGGSDWEWTGSRVGARLEGKSKQRSEIKGSEACGFFSVCVSGPVAQHWSRLAPTGMQLPSDPQAASCPTRRWPPGKGGENGSRNPPNPTQVSNKGQFI